MPLQLSGTSGVLDNSGAFIAGTAVASTSGTSIDFTSIPSWVKRITVMFNGVSTNGISAYIVQLGVGSITTSGYLSNSSYGITAVSVTNGMIATSNLTAASTQSGTLVLTTLGSNTWVSSAVAGANAGGVTLNLSVGNITLGGSLDRIRITTFAGTDTFDAGSINITYE